MPKLLHFYQHFPSLLNLDSSLPAAGVGHHLGGLAVDRDARRFVHTAADPHRHSARTAPRRQLHEIDWQALTGIAADCGCEYRGEASCQRQAEQAINLQRQDERDRLRQERNQRAAGIPPRGAQEALDGAMGHRNEFGGLTDPG